MATIKSKYNLYIFVVLYSANLESELENIPQWTWFYMLLISETICVCLYMVIKFNLNDTCVKEFKNFQKLYVYQYKSM